MRWFLRSLVVLAFAWTVFALSPYAALYGLAEAARAGDLAAIEARVNLRAVRVSISRQVVVAYLRATGREAELDVPTGSLAAGAGATIADPVVAEHVSMEAVARLLQGREARLGEATVGEPLRLASLHAAWRLFAEAESRGFRAISFALPPGRPPGEQVRAQLRLAGFTWRLVGVRLPDAVTDRLVEELVRRNPADASALTPGR
jgi:hypothetical protein